MKFYVFSFILESAVVRSEMEVVLRCKDYIQVDSLTVVDFTMLLICGHAHAHALVVIIVSRFIVGCLFLITLFSLYTLCRIVNKLITNNETRDDNNKRRVTPTVI